MAKGLLAPEGLFVGGLLLGKAAAIHPIVDGWVHLTDAPVEGK